MAPGVIAPEPDGEIHTLRHPILSHVAARAFYSGKEGYVATLAGSLDAPAARPRGLLAAAAAEMSDAQLDTVVRQLCFGGRPTECATWHAYWKHRFPGSALREATWRQTRAALGGNPTASEGLITRLSRFYADEAPGFPNTGAVESARLATLLYARHHQHAIPFPREGLRRAWSRCERGAQALACLDARREATRWLSSLEAAPR